MTDITAPETEPPEYMYLTLLDCSSKPSNSDIAKYRRADLFPQWRPIESAPTAEIILLSDGDVVLQGFWYDGTWRYVGTAEEMPHDITHWMPLPRPPQ